MAEPKNTNTKHRTAVFDDLGVSEYQGQPRRSRGFGLQGLGPRASGFFPQTRTTNTQLYVLLTVVAKDLRKNPIHSVSKDGDRHLGRCLASS